MLYNLKNSNNPVWDFVEILDSSKQAVIINLIIL